MTNNTVSELMPRKKQQPTEERPWVSVEKAAETLELSPSTITLHLNAGLLEGYKKGLSKNSGWRVYVDSIEAFDIARGRIPPKRKR